MQIKQELGEFFLGSKDVLSCISKSVKVTFYVKSTVGAMPKKTGFDIVTSREEG